MKTSSKRFMADFETAVWNPKETWVWAWCFCEIGNEENIKIGTDINEFIDYCYKEKNSIFYFQNLKFDGEFIIYWLLTNGFKLAKTKEEIEDKTFTTLISDMGQFYQIVVYFSKGNKKIHKVTFSDSLKILPFSVSDIAETFKLPISKLEIDYKKERPKGYKLTEEEKDYIKNDVLIVAKALKILFDQKLDRMTQGSNALHDYKEMMTLYKFNHFFPQLTYEIDSDIRKAYKGGFVYVNPDYKEKEVGRGCVLDVNSLFPWAMHECVLPYGEGVFFIGKYEPDTVYDLYIQRITCSFKIKKNKIPCIQIKNNKYVFRENEYLTSSNNKIVSLTLTSVDLKLFFENYDVYDLEFESGWKFKGIQGLFSDYIDKWTKVKIQATIDKNYGLRTLAKLMLNSLYGKFATSLDCQSKFPYINEEGIIKYELSEKTTKNGVYLPVGAFITAYAREKTIRTSQAIHDYSIKKYGRSLYYYSDTDSIHCGLSIEELKQFCDIDPVRLGAWKHEGTFTKAKFIRQKCYIEEIDGKIEITCAGMPKSCYDFVTWENFKTGFSCGGKLTFKHVKGGVILVDTEFTIKEETTKQHIENF